MRKINVIKIRVKSQALLELTILASIFMFLLASLIRFGVTMNERQSLMMHAMRDSVKRASSDDVAANYLQYSAQYFRDIAVPDPSSATGVSDLEEMAASGQAMRTHFLNVPQTANREASARMHYVVNGYEYENPYDQKMTLSQYKNARPPDEGLSNAIVEEQYNNRPQTGLTTEGYIFNYPVNDDAYIVRKIADPMDKLEPYGVFWAYVAFRGSVVYSDGLRQNIFVYRSRYEDDDMSEDYPLVGSYQTFGTPDFYTAANDIEMADLKPGVGYVLARHDYKQIKGTDISGLTNPYFADSLIQQGVWRPFDSATMLYSLHQEPILARGQTIVLDPERVALYLVDCSNSDECRSRGTDLIRLAGISKYPKGAWRQPGHSDYNAKAVALLDTLIQAFQAHGSEFNVVALHADPNFKEIELRYNYFSKIASMDLSSSALGDINLSAFAQEGIQEYQITSNMTGINVEHVKIEDTYKTKTKVSIFDQIKRVIFTNPFGALKGKPQNITFERNKTDELRYRPEDDAGWQTSN